MIDELMKLSQTFLGLLHQEYRRYFIKKQPFTHRLTILLGQRGIGKSTCIVQHLMDVAEHDLLSPRILYIQADHFLLQNYSLYGIAEAFSLNNGKVLAIDEIHKYSNWSSELKSIYDTFPDLQIIASGSSALEIHKGSHDLSRRAVIHTMVGLSFREYLEMKFDITLPSHSIPELTQNHQAIANALKTRLNDMNEKILPNFRDYLRVGYYPYSREFKETASYYLTLEQQIHTSLESDLPAVYPQLTGLSIKKTKILFEYIVSSVPFTPNLTKLRTILEIGDIRTLKNYIKYLEDSGLIQTILSSTNTIRRLEVPGEIFLSNTNLIYALNPLETNTNIGTVRETFFLSMIAPLAEITHPRNGDFLPGKEYTFEVGGRKKDSKQITNIEKGFLACDYIETGFGNKLPLWLFGFLY